MKKRELLNMGIPPGEALVAAMDTVVNARELNMDKRSLRDSLLRVTVDPQAFVDDGIFGALARAMCVSKPQNSGAGVRSSPIQWPGWGKDIDPEAARQMDNACRLPISLAAALMPDAHVGYGLPIGGVLATENAVIPYAVGMDIACRMKLTVLDMPLTSLRGEELKLIGALENETCFGVGGRFGQPRYDHQVMHEDWSVSPVTDRLKKKAWGQLGTSGSGNHFVEFGVLTMDESDLGLDAGQYVALLSHSGSRGTGGEVATHYSKLARTKHPELPKEMGHLAWLDMDSTQGREYWAAMELMGRYAAANHELIHGAVARALKVKVMLDIENHHNFAWKEKHFGRDVIVHRKGATPAWKGALAIIPGSMATPGFVVRGKGKPESLNSASHGAGRKLSRKAAMETLTWHDTRKFLEERGVTLISAGLDESPFGYKDIETVMAEQRDLVKVIARFDPKIVKMAPSENRGRRRK